LRLLIFLFVFQVWILCLSEDPFHSPTFEPKDVFNWTATYRRDSDLPTPYFRWVYYDERVKQLAELDHNYAANKTKKASCSVAVLLDIAMFCIAQFVMPLGTEWHKTAIFIFYTVSMSPSPKQYISHHQIYV
jgi:hypothetical protein